MEKKELRKMIRERKREHTEAELRAMSEKVCEALLAHERIAKAHTVLLYWALDDEVCTHDLVEKLHRMGKVVLLPKVISDTEMSLHRYTGRDSMALGAYGIMEPQDTALDDQAIEALGDMTGIIPGMAFDNAGHRLGRGKGYYDRMLLAHASIYKIGVCFPFQVVGEVPYDKYDILMNEVIY